MEKIKKKTGILYPYIQAIPDYLRYQTITGIILFIIINIIRMVFRALLASADKTAITSSDIKFLFTSWQGISLLIVAMFTVAVYIVFELNGLIIMSGKLLKGEDVKIFEIIKEAIYGFRKFFNFKSILLIIYIAVLAPLTGVLISISLTRYFYIPTFISSVIDSTPIYHFIYSVAMFFLLLVYFFYCFTMHGMILDDLDFDDAMHSSSRLVKKNWKDLLWQHLHFVVIQVLSLGIVFILTIIIPYIFQQIYIDDIFRMRFAALVTVISGNVIIAMMTLYISASYIIKMTRLYEGYKIEKIVYYPIRKKQKITILIVRGALVIALILGVAYFSARFFDEFFTKSYDVPIIAHRGGGNEGNENTVSGLMTAYSLGAYGSEIDVQRTKDGYYIINHDSDFARVASVNRKPGDMTLEEIKRLDINGDEVATIEEMLDASHGRIILFIELKGESADEQMADDMAKLIIERGMKDQAVLISLKYELINYIENKYPDIKTAYLTFVSFGDIAKLNCDYVGLEEESATDSNIVSIHENNKKVLVWTVNNEESQRRFLATQVDGIITDNVSQANRIKKELDERDDIMRIFDLFLFR